MFEKIVDELILVVVITVAAVAAVFTKLNDKLGPVMTTVSDDFGAEAERPSLGWRRQGASREAVAYTRG